MNPELVTGRGTRLPTVAGYAATLRSHLGAIIVLAVLGLVCGLFIAQQKPHMYKASASIELPDLPTFVDVNPDPPAPQRTTIDTTSELVFSQPVYDAVEEATGLSESKVRSGLNVGAYPLSRVLIVTFTAPTMDLAVAGANAAAEQTRIERTTILPGAQTAGAKVLERRLERLRDKSRVTVREFTPQTQELTNQILQIGDAIDAGANASGTIVNRADLASTHLVKRHRELQLVTGTVLGILLGIGYSWWRRDKHLHHDPRIIGLAAKVRPHRRSGPRSRRPGRGPRRRPSHSHGV
jgi:uncharacterized protein involved in exopolysaccharide biosynthesis